MLQFDAKNVDTYQPTTATLDLKGSSVIEEPSHDTEPSSESLENPEMEKEKATPEKQSSNEVSSLSVIIHHTSS